MKDALQTLVDRNAERATLGACLIDPDQLIDVINIIDEEAFWLDGHRYLYRAMVDLFTADKPIDLLTVADAIRVYTNIENVGNGSVRGLAYITGLMTDEIYSHHAGYYAEIVNEMARRREVVSGCQLTATEAMDLSKDLVDVIENGCQVMLKASVNGANELRPMGADLELYTREVRRKIRTGDTSVPGIPTGFNDIDQRTLGLEPGKLWVVAGRPGMGKTAWLIAMTHMLSVEQDYHGAIFSLEMSRNELYKRLIAYQTKVNLQDLAKGDLMDEEARKVEKAMAALEEAKDRIWIDDTGGLTPTQVRARATKVMIQSEIDYLWLDFLQLMRVPEARGSSQQYILATVAARELKNLAKALYIPVIAASQLSRKVEEKGDKRPELSHLRDSGAIEEAADLVGFLYREGYYKEEADQGKACFIISKQRDGPAGVDVPLTFLSHCAGYYNHARLDLNL